MRHLRGRGFTEAELTLSGLVSQGQRGVYDRFRGRLVWPIREVTGETVGFGARRLFDEDQGPKYLNTPETAALQEVAGALRHRPGQAGPAARQAGGRRRGLHRRHGHAPVRGRHRRGHLRHRVRLGPRTHRAPAHRRLGVHRRRPAGVRRVGRRRDHLHVRRRRRRSEGRAAGVRRGPVVLRADVRRRREVRHGPVRAAPGQGSRRRPRAGGRPDAAVRVRHPLDPRVLRPAHRRGSDRRPARRRPDRRRASATPPCGPSTRGC